MDINSLEILKITLGSAGFLGIMAAIAVLTFRTGKIVQKIEDMGRKFENLEGKVDKFEERMNVRFREVDDRMNERFREVDERMNERFRKLEENLPTINIAITRLEVRLEERTIRTVDIAKKELPSWHNADQLKTQ